MSKKTKTKKSRKQLPTTKPIEAKKKNPFQDEIGPGIHDLTYRQKAFVRHFLVHRNATRAAVLAGYAVDSANREGSRLLSNAVIQAFIEENEKVVAKQFEITQAQIVQELAAIAFFNIKSVMREDRSGARMKSWSDLEESTTKAISSVTEHSGRDSSSVGFKSYDKVRALELLGKNIGMWRDKDAGHGTDLESRKAVIARVSEFFSKSRKSGGAGGSSKG